VEAIQAVKSSRDIRYKVLLYERNALISRIKSSDSKLLTLRQVSQKALPPQDETPTPLVATLDPCSHSQTVLTSDDATGARRRVSSSSVVPTRSGRQRFTDDDFDELPRPLHAFRDHASISYEEISRFMPPSQQWYKAHHNAVSAAMTAYLQSVCAHFGRGIREICWFHQLPYTLTSGYVHLSHSSGALSPECCLSLSLAFPAFSAEALFLVLEHEELEAATTDVLPPAHPELDALFSKDGLNLNEGLFDVVPEDADAQVLDRLKVLFLCLCDSFQGMSEQ
jgi:hypothetical protein